MIVHPPDPSILILPLCVISDSPQNVHSTYQFHFVVSETVMIAACLIFIVFQVKLFSFSPLNTFSPQNLIPIKA